jgi:hypothetical protein
VSPREAMVINCRRRRYGVVWHVANRRLRAMGTTFTAFNSAAIKEHLT